MSHALETSIARLEERVSGVEDEVDLIRPRLHALGNAVAPVGVLVSDVEKHEEQLQELRSMLKAARWLIIIAAPLIALATAATPFVVRATIRDAMEQRP